MASSQRTKDLIIAIPVSVILFAMVSLVISAVLNKEEEQKSPPRVLVRNVVADSVTFSSQRVVVSANGRVVSGSPISVFSQGVGELMPASVPLKVGQRFKKGDTLINVSSSVFVLQLAAQRSKFLHTLANALPELELDYSTEAPHWNTYLEEIQVDQVLPAMPQVSNNKLKTFLSARGIISSYYDIKANEQLLEFYTYEAPFDGSISSVQLEVGSYANKGALVAEVVQRSNVEIEVPISARDIRYVSIGDRAIVKDEISQSAWEGRVVRISDLIDPVTQSRLCFIRIPSLGSNEVLVEGMYPHIDIYGGVIDSVFVLPRSAVFNSDEVFEVRDSLIFKKNVDVVRLNEEEAFIRGVELGSVIVKQPLPGAREGIKVAVIQNDTTTEVRP